MKILVAGAGGYLGIPLCRKLVEKGHSVVALDRYFFGRNRIESLAENPRATIVTEDIRSVDPGMLSGVDVIVDLAGLSNDASAEIDPGLTRSINCDGGMHLAQTAKEAGVR